MAGFDDSFPLVEPSKSRWKLDETYSDLATLDVWLNSLISTQVDLPDLERFAGVDGATISWDPLRHGERSPFWNEGALGCLRSLRGVLARAQAEGLDACLVREDDCRLAPDAVSRVREATAHTAFRGVPWHLLYLGGNHVVEPLLLSDDEDEPTPGPCSVRRALRTVALHAILVHSRAFETLLTLLGSEAAPSDMLIAHRYMAMFPCFTLEPRIAVQRPGHSDIRRKFVDYADLLGTLGGDAS